MPPLHLTNFKIQKNYQNKPKFNDLPKIKEKSIRTNWVVCTWTLMI